MNQSSSTSTTSSPAGRSAWTRAPTAHASRSSTCAAARRSCSTRSNSSGWRGHAMTNWPRWWRPVTRPLHQRRHAREPSPHVGSTPPPRRRAASGSGPTASAGADRQTLFALVVDDRLKETSMTPPTKFAHVVYNTHRYDEMIGWYTLVFEARIQHHDERLTFMTYDDEHHRFAFANLGPL